MTGSSPKPNSNPQNSKPSVRKPANKPASRYPTKLPPIPWVTIGALFGIYVVIGLLLSLPAPPLLTWIPAVIGTGLMIWGLNRPMAVGNSSDRVGLLTYVGAFLLVVAIAIGANYIGGGKGFDDIRFFVALFGLAVLTILSVALAAAAAIVSAQTGASLMQNMGYKRSMSVLMSTCFLGALVGGLIGFLTLFLKTSVS
jgi:hypothetical protein